MYKTFITGPSPVGKPYNRPAGMEMHSPLWWLAPPPCPVGSMSLDSRVAGLPYESSSFATSAVRWGGKRKAPLNFSFPLEGKCHIVAKGCTRVNIPMKLTIVLLSLTSPHLEVLCGTSTGALWMLSHGAMSLQESIERFILSPDGVAREHESHQRTYFEGTQ